MLSSTFFHRQLDILPPSRAVTPIVVIGAGGIGSWTALCLAKIGCSNIIVFDPDVVEEHNLPSQLYTPEYIGKKKVEALKYIIKDMIDTTITERPEAWDGETVAPIVVSAVDSMKTRVEIFDKLKTRYGVALYIDGRMGAEILRLSTLRPADSEQAAWYEKTLYTDEESVDAPCTARAIAYNTLVIGGIISSLVKHFLVGEFVPREIIFSLSDYTLYVAKKKL